MKLFLTGKPGSGKSTVLLKVIELLKKRMKIGGIVTPEMKKEGRRIGFLVKDVFSGEEEILAKVSRGNKPRVGKYVVFVDDFERVALKSLDFAVRECDLVVVDELGRMEFFSKKFKQKIYEILKLDKLLLACLHRNFVNDFKRYGKVMEVTPKNRERLPEEIVDLILQSTSMVI